MVYHCGLKPCKFARWCFPLIEAILAGLLLGLGSGLQCTVICLPILSVQLLTGKRTIRDSLTVAGIFSLGRLVSYLTIASLIYVAAQSLSYALQSSQVKGMIMVLLASVLLYYFSRSLKGKPHGGCRVYGQSKPTLLLGLFSSFSICLPLVALLSFSASYDLFTTYASIAMFWVGTSVYTLGVASSIGGIFRMKGAAAIAQRVSLISSMASGLLGLVFLLSGLGWFLP
jgi:hypothetical protein